MSFLGKYSIFIVNCEAFIKELMSKGLMSRDKDFPNIPLHESNNIVCMGKVIIKKKKKRISLLNKENKYNIVDRRIQKKELIMKKLLFVILMVTAFSALNACSDKTAPDIDSPLSMIGEEGEIISLYMPENEARSILGETGEPGNTGIYNFGTIRVGFTDGKVSYIDSDNEYWELPDKNKVGAPIQNATQYHSAELTNGFLYHQDFSFKDGEYTSIEKTDLPPKISADNFEEYQGIDISVREDSVDLISVYDKYVAMSWDFDSNADAQAESVAQDDSFPNYDSFSSELTEVLVEIGATDFSSASIDTFEKDDNGDINAGISIETPQHSLHIDCSYYDILGTWSVIQVYDINTEHCYYTPSGSRFTDIYDYKTDTLVSESQESFEDFDPLEEFEDALENNEAEFDRKMESIADEYGLSYNP